MGLVLGVLIAAVVSQPAGRLITSPCCTYNTNTGAASGSASYDGTSASGSYDPGTGHASGAVSTSSGAGGSASGNVNDGTGTGEVHTQYGNASVSADGNAIHAGVDVPGVGSVNVSPPADPADW